MDKLTEEEGDFANTLHKGGWNVGDIAHRIKARREVGVHNFLVQAINERLSKKGEEQSEQRRRINRRLIDRKWFMKMLGKDFMIDLTIHHIWNMEDHNKEYCHLLSLREHRILEGIAPKEAL